MTDRTGTATPDIPHDGQTYYDTAGNVLEVRTETGVDAQGNKVFTSTQYTYQNGNLTTISENGVLTSTMTYDEKNRLRSTTDQSGRTTWFEYDANGNQTKSWYTWTGTDQNNQPVTHTVANISVYDEDDRVTGTRLEVDGVPQGATETHYDPVTGLVDYTVDPYGVKTYNVYDFRGLLTETYTGAEFALDGQGNPIPTQPTKYTVTRTVYDSNGRAIYTGDAHVENALTSDPTQPDAVASYGTRTIYDDSRQRDPNGTAKQSGDHPQYRRRGRGDQSRQPL